MITLTSPVDIRADHLEIVQDILRTHLPAGFEVWVFGSRANWTTKDSSDLDLAVEGDASLDHGVMVGLEIAFEESDLPYTVDVVDLNLVDARFKQIVEMQRVPLIMATEQSTVGEWRKCELRDLTDNFDSIRVPVKQGNRRRGTYPYYGASGVIDYVDGFLFDGEYLLIAEDGENLRTRTAPMAFLATGKFWVNNHAHIVRGNSNADARFLKYALSQLDVSGYLTGSTMPKLTQENMNRISVLTPPLPEQRAIAHILGTLDDKIELNRRMNQTLEEMARAIFQDSFVDFGPVRAKLAGSDPYLPPDLWSLFPDRLVDSELGEIPEGWDVKELGDLIELAYGKALKAGERKGGAIPVYGSNGQVGWHDDKLVDGPGIVVGRKGNPGVVTWSHSDFFPIDTAFYVTPKDASPNLPFLLYALDSQDLPSIAADSAVPGLNRNLAYMNTQVVPDKMIAGYFNDYASIIFERRHQLEEESRSLASQRDALLPKLVSGEVRERGLSR